MAVVGQDVQGAELLQVEGSIPGRKEHPPAMCFVGDWDAKPLFEPQRLLKISAALITSHRVSATVQPDLDRLIFGKPGYSWLKLCLSVYLRGHDQLEAM